MMDHSRERLGRVLAAGFLVLFAGLLFIVPRVMRLAASGGRDKVLAEWRAVLARSPWFSRGLGLVVAVCGLGFMRWAWVDAHTQRALSIRLAMIGPSMIGFGVYLLVEAPELPIETPSWLGWVATMLGAGAGWVYMEFLRTGRLPLLS